MVTKNELLFDYLLKNPEFTIRDLVVWTDKKPFCFNCGHSAVRQLKKYIANKGFELLEEWVGNHEYKKFTLISQNISESGQVSLF